MSLLKWLPRVSRRSPSITRVFSNQSYERVPENQQIEEETFPNYLAARYYPIRTGEVLESRYQVIGKLGFGAFSTVWLARDLK
jgi:serine/threonine-protein kinase SRPK3